MNRSMRLLRSLPWPLLAGLLGLLGNPAPLSAQPPPATVTIERPPIINPFPTMSGTLRLDIRLGTPPAGWQWEEVRINVYRSVTPVGLVVERAATDLINQNLAHYEWVTTVHEDNRYRLEAEARLSNGTQSYLYYGMGRSCSRTTR